MLLRHTHRYVAEASGREGRRLGALALAPDFAPAAEWAHWQGLRRGMMPAFAHHGAGVVEPVFDGVLKAPFVVGFRVRFDVQEPTYEAPMIPWRYVQPAVQEGATRLVTEGVLQADETFAYRVCAFPLATSEAPPVAPPRGACEEVSAPLALSKAALAPRLGCACRAGEAAWSATDFPLIVPSALLAEAQALARAAGDHETGGILVGHLRRDTASPEIYVEITAQIPATLAEAGRTHLGFTPEAWSAVSAALALRRRNEIILGWWHFHPFFCRRCAPARRRQCALSRPFFSREDQELHRAVFDTAFSVALLLSDVGEASLRCDWFGWRYGSIAARGCYRLDGG